jgi:tetrahydromethanopterin S-methyltransferase subunit B
MTEITTVVAKAELMTQNAEQVNKKLQRLEKEINDLWEGMDYLSNPYGG